MAAPDLYKSESLENKAKDNLLNVVENTQI